MASGLLLGLLAGSIPALFTNDDLVREAATPLILTVALLQPLAGLVFTADGLFQERYVYRKQAHRRCMGRERCNTCSFM